MLNTSIRPLRLAVCALALALPAAAQGTDEVFVDLSPEKALKRAKDEKKVLLMAWTKEWEALSKKMEATFQDDSVRAWFTKHTIPVRLDPEKQVKLSNKHRVNMVPTVVLINASGVEIDRVQGYFTPQEFVANLDAMLAGRIGEGAGEKPTGEGLEDPMAWLAYANRLFSDGEDADGAVRAYAWCHEHGERFSPGFGEKYQDFIFKRIMTLKNHSDDAKPKMIEWRDLLATKIYVGDADEWEMHTFGRINYWLKDWENSIEMYEKLTEYGDEKQKQLQAILFEEILVRMVAERKYTQVVAGVGDAMGYINKRIEGYKKAVKDGVVDDRGDIVWDGTHLYEALLAVGRGKDAVSLKDALVEAFPTGRTYGLLIDHAARVEQYAVARKVAEEGKEKLGKKGDRLLKKKLDDMQRTIAKAKEAKEREQEESDGE